MSADLSTALENLRGDYIEAALASFEVDETLAAVKGCNQRFRKILLEAVIIVGSKEEVLDA